MSTPAGAYRPLTDWEKRVVLRLLEPAFPGRDALLAQVEDLVARPIDENGSLEFQRLAPPKNPPHSLIPTEGEALDVDSTAIHYLMFSLDGNLDMLEVYKDDSSPVVRHPDPKEIKVVILR